MTRKFVDVVKNDMIFNYFRYLDSQKIEYRYRTAGKYTELVMVLTEAQVEKYLKRYYASKITGEK